MLFRAMTLRMQPLRKMGDGSQNLQHILEQNNNNLSMLDSSYPRDTMDLRSAAEEVKQQD